ncbi:Deoxyribonucleoside regulator [Microbacterium azadirachtae]|uniref:Deoxyribonucleoside regulator n=1 Tax=Microbacterium azadirachtae TaxID=582680 RepID=A0A0F0KDJ3_9MICO|nr:sugar-binding domain-containing protein [Microbacterium azadirachtae]KJL18928.1 Deoxyribonucleoside regulator [Microbacterium azadirachtae]
MSIGPLTEQLRSAYAAVQHLQHGRPMLELAEELQVSRFTVSRMIDRARASGLVEVVTRMPDAIDPALSSTLQQRFDLDAAYVVVPAVDSEQGARTAIAHVAARVLAETIEEDDLVGVGPGRTILETLGMLTTLPSCDAIQLTGVASSDPMGSLRALMRMSEVSGGRQHPLHAPFVSTDAAACTAISSQPAVADVLRRMGRLDKAVLTVGGWPESSLLARQLDALGELERMLEAGIVAEFGTTLLDSGGREVRTLEDRFIGVTTEQLARVPLSMALGGGPGKDVALLAVLRSGLVNVVITDAARARFALAHD